MGKTKGLAAQEQRFLNDDLTPVPWKLHEIDELVRNGKAGLAMGLMQQLEDLFGMQDEFYARKSHILDSLGRHKEADAVRASCEDKMVADANIDEVLKTRYKQGICDI